MLGSVYFRNLFNAGYREQNLAEIPIEKAMHQNEFMRFLQVLYPTGRNKISGKLL